MRVSLHQSRREGSPERFHTDASCRTRRVSYSFILGGNDRVQVGLIGYGLIGGFDLKNQSLLTQCPISRERVLRLLVTRSVSTLTNS